jgi:hypothetical protein
MNNVEIVNLFSLNVYTSHLGSIDNSAILNEIAEHSGAAEDSKEVNPAHLFYEDRTYPFGRPESEKLLTEIEKTVSSALGKEMKVSSIWTLSLEKGQSVTAHSHKVNTHLRPEEYFSVSYYVNAPKNSADLVFTTTHCNTIETSTRIVPITGLLVIFNSYITHMTNRHYNEEPRVVVSANLSPVSPNLFENPDWSQYARPQWTKKAYDKAYILDIDTPFGKEQYTLGLYNDGSGEVLFGESRQKVDNYALNNEKLTTDIDVDVPMTTKVQLELSIDSKTNQILGSAKFGEFMECAITGKQIK